MDNSWSREEALYLISLYKDRPCLYDPRNENYRNKKKRQSEYNSLQDAIHKIKPGANSQSIRKKLSRLQFQLAKEEDEIVRANHENREYTPKLWCFEELRFLKNARDAAGVELTNAASDHSDCEMRDLSQVEEPPIETELMKEREAEQAQQQTFDIINHLRKEAKANVEVAKSLLQDRSTISKEDAFGKLVALELKELQYKESYDIVVGDIKQCLRDIKAKDRQLYYEAIVRNGKKSARK